MKNELIEKILEKYLLGEETTTDKTITNPFVWQYVIVRGYDAWVWCGKLVDWTPWNIILEDARMLWRRWCKEGVWLSWLSSYWLADKTEVKILETQKKILITDNRVSTFFPVGSEVEKQLRDRKVAEQS